MLRPKVRYRLSDVLALRDERAPERPTLVELAAKIADLEARLAKVEENSPRAKRKAMEARLRKTDHDTATAIRAANKS